LPASIATFHSDLEKLIRKFDADQQHYSSKDYLEAQARTDFLTPFFQALGWDVENEAGLGHHDRKVLVEKGDMEVTGRPDYNFRMAARPSFTWKPNRLPSRSTPRATSCKPKVTSGTPRAYFSSSSQTLRSSDSTTPLPSPPQPLFWASAERRRGSNEKNDN
jgi:hypothetical protein